MSETYLVLFPDVKNGMGLYKAMKQAGMPCEVSFSPAKVEKICGITVRFQDASLEEAIRQLAAEQHLTISRIVSAAEFDA